jgi:hypothetical protein
MPKWLQGIVGPTLMLWLCALSIGVVRGAGPGGEELSVRADIVSRVAFPFIVALWVAADARKRGRQLCYDFESFVFFAGWLIVPIYLFQTRGLGAFKTLLCFAVLCVVAGIASLVVSTIRGAFCFEERHKSARP